MSSRSVDKPVAALAENLERAHQLQVRMTELLVRLEQNRTLSKPPLPGLWRHHPLDWQKQYLSETDHSSPKSP